MDQFPDISGQILTVMTSLYPKVKNLGVNTTETWVWDEVIALTNYWVGIETEKARIAFLSKIAPKDG